MLTPAATAQLRQHLTELPELLVRTHLALVPGSTPHTSHVSGGRTEAPLPLNLQALDLLGPRHDSNPGPTQLIGWARYVIWDRRAANDWTGWVPPGSRELHPAGWRESAASTAIGCLLLHCEFAAGREYAHDLADDVRATHRALDRTAGGTSTLWQPVTIPCPRCRLLTMRQRTDGYRECANPDCWAVVSRDEYTNLATAA
ncbi:hypothetical protein ACIQF6_14860 [Kitasatospora sp. NPDC092948]|uniref:hypothetical protein n=1 Tax=Kitasatospora sp. NPDC092948 TaxID=3364088 RepID=UPI0037F2A7C0